MMQKRLSARNARRGSNRASAQEIELPLPLRGIFTRAKSAKVSNLFAAELFNLRSDGVSLNIRPGVEWLTRRPTGVLQRIPFEFGGASHYIELTEDKAEALGVIYARAFNGQAMTATNSQNVLIADGLGLPLRYDGTTFTPANFTAASGPNPAECDGIISHHDRIYLWKTGGPLEFLVGDVGAVLGPMSNFPLGRLGNITGSILSMVSLTIDAGHGMNDVLCIITTTGQMVLYEGMDPTDPQDWRLLGRVAGAAPLGRLAFAQVGADAWMLTAQGPVSIGQAARESVLALVSDVSQPICDEIRALAGAGPAEWQMFTAIDGSMCVINRYAGGESLQYIYDLESRSWNTANYPARHWHNLGGMPQFTSASGRIGNLRRLGSDEVITGRWVSSWFTAGRGGSVEYIEPTIISHGPLTVRAVVLADNQDTPADISEAEQTITIEPEEGSAARITLSDIIPTDASGKKFQITLEVTARWAQITELRAALGS